MKAPRLRRLLTVYLGAIAVIGGGLQVLSHTVPAAFCAHYAGVPAADVSSCTELFHTSVLYGGVAAKHIFFIYIALLPFAVWHNLGERENWPLLQIGCVALVFVLVGNVVMVGLAHRAGEIGPIHPREYVLAIISVVAMVQSFRQRAGAPRP